MISPRVILAAAVLVACLFAAGAGILLAERREDLAAIARPQSFAGALRPKAPAPPLKGLRDQDGKPVDMKALRGEPVVVTFVYSTCEDTCPAQVAAIRGALDRLERDIEVIAVSVDPANDTPRRAKKFLSAQYMTGRMQFMLGEQRDLERVWRRYGIQPQTGELEHSAYIVLLDRSGVQRVGWPHEKLTTENLEHDLRLLLATPA